MSESVTTKNSDLLLYAGTGTLTITENKSLSTTNQLLTITVDDFDNHADSLISTGDVAMSIHATSPSHSIGIGNSARQMHLTDAELGVFYSNIGLTIGDDSSGDISLDGVLDSNSDTFGLLTLQATKAGRNVLFTGSDSSFNKGILIKAAGGINLDASVTTKSSPLVLDTSTGTLTVSVGVSLSSTSQALTITADDMNLQADSLIESGTASILVVSASSIPISIGATGGPGTMSMDNFKPFSGAGLTIGRDGMNKNIVVVGVSNEHMNINGIMSLVATVDQSSVHSKQRPRHLTH
jgi:hypothetical protein